MKIITKVAAIGALMTVCTAIGGGPAMASTSHCPAWDGVEPQAPAQAILDGVTALPSCTAWAVGTFSGPGSDVAEIQQIDGASWMSQPSAGGSVMRSVAAISDSDAWAVGDQNGQAVTQHWDGTAWTTEPVPQPGHSDATILAGVAASSTGGVWAVGNYGSRGSRRTLILRWTGQAWKQAPSPSPGGASRLNTLTSVTVVSAKSAWAVGYYQTASQYRQTLILHWNGATWRQVPSPNPGQTRNAVLFGVAATATGHAWAVGYLLGHPGFLTLFLQWTGQSWVQIPSPNPTPLGRNLLLSVAATSTSNVWAVGWDSRQGDNPVGLILHWDGQSWTQYLPPHANEGSLDELINGVATARGNAWAVGEFDDDSTNGAQGLILHWSGRAHGWQD